MSTYTVKMPDIGEGVVEGEVIEWLKQVGDSVGQDEPVVIVMTDKATVELPAPTPGKLSKQYYQPGQMAQRDKPLYDLEVLGELEPSKKEAKPKESTAAPSAPPKASRPHSSGHSTGQSLAIPAVRKMALNLGIDLEKVTGTGIDGRITENDLSHYISKSSTPSISRLEDDEEQPLVGIRHQMALHMKQAHEIIPHFSYFEQVDATRLIQLRERLKMDASQEGVKMTFMPLFIRALSRTLQHYPQINSSYDASQNRLILHKHHNIGIAFSTSQGLIVPVLKDVETWSLEEIIRNFETLKKKVSENKLQPADMRDATITISNYGVLGSGGLFATPIIQHPAVAILALAKIQRQPIVKKDQVVPCDMLNLSWSFDHRVIDGELAATVSHHFCLLIQNPAQLL